jgi:hypothetical protein
MRTILHSPWFLVAVAYLVLNIPLAVFLGRMIRVGQQGDKPPSDPFRQPAQRAMLDAKACTAGAMSAADLRSSRPQISTGRSRPAIRIPTAEKEHDSAPCSASVSTSGGRRSSMAIRTTCARG